MGREIAQQWRMKGYNLRFERTHFSRNPGKLVTEKLPQTGFVYSFTVIDREHAPSGFEYLAPYVEALVILDGIEEMITTRLTDLNWQYKKEVIDGEERDVVDYGVEIGMRVEMATRKGKDLGEHEMLAYTSCFRPSFSSPTEASKSSK